MSGFADDVRRLGLVRLGAATHSVDQGPRDVPLSFARGQGARGTRAVGAPASTAVAPPGDHLLFGVDARGVPSVADVVRVDPDPTGTASTAVTLTHDGSDVGPGPREYLTFRLFGATPLADSLRHVAAMLDPGPPSESARSDR